MAWAFLGHRPSSRFVWSSLVAVVGIGLLFVHEFRQHSARADEIALGIGLTLIGMIGASAANVFQAREEVRRFPLFSMLAWSICLSARWPSRAARFTSRWKACSGRSSRPGR